MSQQLLESFEDRYSYPEEEKYTGYNSDMFTLLGFSRSIYDIVATNHWQYNEHFYVILDFENKCYAVSEGYVTDVPVKKGLYHFYVNTPELFDNFLDYHDLYYYLKLRIDNDLRLTRG